MTNITQALLQEHLHYDRHTGLFTWVKSDSGRKMNQPAGTVAADGYVRICILGKQYPAHWLAWLYVYGEWPHNKLDHRNRNKADNNINNLRLATNSQNQHNKGLMKNNKSGLKGVRFKKGKWEASCQINGRRKYLGRFITAKKAHEAYTVFASSNVGEFFTKGDHP